MKSNRLYIAILLILCGVPLQSNGMSYIKSCVGAGKQESTQAEQKNHDIQECPICKDDFKAGDCIATLKCHASHQFHVRCIRDSIATSKKADCPLCRSKVKSPDDITFQKVSKDMKRKQMVEKKRPSINYHLKITGIVLTDVIALFAAYKLASAYDVSNVGKIFSVLGAGLFAHAFVSDFFDTRTPEEKRKEDYARMHNLVRR